LRVLSETRTSKKALKQKSETQEFGGLPNKPNKRVRKATVACFFLRLRLHHPSSCYSSSSSFFVFFVLLLHLFVLLVLLVLLPLQKNQHKRQEVANLFTKECCKSVVGKNQNPKQNKTATTNAQHDGLRQQQFNMLSSNFNI